MTMPWGGGPPGGICLAVDLEDPEDQSDLLEAGRPEPEDDRERCGPQSAGRRPGERRQSQELHPTSRTLIPTDLEISRGRICDVDHTSQLTPGTYNNPEHVLRPLSTSAATEPGGWTAPDLSHPERKS